jgi:hypothetical protein
MVFYEERPPRDDQPSQPGCMDALVITRVVFQMLFWPVAAMILVVGDIALVFYLFALHPALAVIPIAATAGAVMLFARWDQQRGRPEGFD